MARPSLTMEKLEMTEPQRRAITVGVVTTVLGALLLTLIGRAWESKVDQATYDLHIQAEQNVHERQMEITLELLCELKPTNRRCR